MNIMNIVIMMPVIITILRIYHYHMMTSYIKETGMLVKNLLTHLARLVNHKRPGVYAKVMEMNQLNKLSNEMNIIRMNARSQQLPKIVTRTRSSFRNRTVYLSKVSD